MSALPLSGQVALISGGAGDIGRAIARELAALGADIALGDIVADAPAEVAAIRASGRRCCYDRVDVGDAAAGAAWVAQCERELGFATLVIPNAAVVSTAGVADITPTEWQRQLRVNLDGAFFLAQAAVQRLLAARKPGRVVFIGSWAADHPHPTMPAYCAAKAGMRALMQCLALEVAPAGILVNEVAPGYVDAGLSGKIFARDPAVKDAATKRVPIRRLIAAEDVAFQVAHCCHPRNQHQTGSVLTMDGGLSLLSTGG